MRKNAIHGTVPPVTKTISVVAAVLVVDGKILLARRRPGKNLAGYWEFPGGKIESGESPEKALERELHEEFSIETRTGKLLGTNLHRYPDFQVELSAYWSELLSGEFRLTDHDEVRWVVPRELSQFRLAPADVPFLAMIC